MTSSMRNFELAGSTNPASWLTIMSGKADRELLPVRPDQLACFGPRIVIVGFSFFLRHAPACS